MIIQILITLFTIVVLWDYFTKARRNSMCQGIPGPTTLPLIGNLINFAGQNSETALQYMLNNQARYGKLYRLWIFRKLVFLSGDPKDLEVVLSSPQLITKNNLYDSLYDWLGTGLLMSTGKKWHSRRKIITPTFHFKILEQFVEVFDQQSAVLVDKLKEFADGKTAVNLFPKICLMALDIITETAMGTKINAQTNPNLPYVKAVTNITNIISNRLIRVWQRIDIIFHLVAFQSAKVLKESIREAHQFTEEIIMERRQALHASMLTAESLHKPVDNLDVNEKKRMALLDVLLQSTIDGKPLSNADIREEVDTFMFEGHDTTTSAISFCLYLISRHPEVQQKIFDEIKEVIGTDKTRPVSLRDLSDLKYLECVIKESLRLYPPVAMIGRYFSDDVLINGKILPGNSSYNVSIYSILRNPELFPNPDVFNPERFVSESLADEKINAYAYIPFSAGPRNCIGQKFAMLEMKSTVSKMLRNFELLPLGPEVRPMLTLVIRSITGAHVGLKARV